MESWKQLLLVLAVALQLSIEADTISPQTGEVTKPLHLLTLVPLQETGTCPSGQQAEGLSMLSGARIAQDQINNLSDLLPGYHVELIVKNIESCSCSEAGIGLSNLMEHTTGLSSTPVVAITGLVCSSHTEQLSPIAGHLGFDLLQFSAANSPIFQTRKEHFPHLWHLVGSATVYSETVLAIMKQFGWKRIGIVYNTRSDFYSETAQHMEHLIKSSSNMTTAFSINVNERQSFKNVISTIYSTRASIMVVLLDSNHTSTLLHQAASKGMTHPKYTWIHIETKNEDYNANNIIRGNLMLRRLTTPQNESTTLVSGMKYKKFSENYFSDLELVAKIYNSSMIKPDLEFASYLHDQVWAFALAVNKSLPVLKRRNLTITIGQKQVTAVIEDHLEGLSFQGAGGWVDFNQYSSVAPPQVEILWILKNGTEKHVGLYNPQDPRDFFIDINTSDLPNDTIELPIVVDLIPTNGAYILYLLIIAVVILITAQLILYLYYREHHVIKATSPNLSMLMFIGCYLQCLSSACKVTLTSTELPEIVYTTMSVAYYLTFINGLGLILVTLFVKLTRIHRIFNTPMKNLGKCWHNCPLLFIILLLMVLPNIIFLLVFIRQPPSPITYLMTVTREDGTILIEKHIKITLTSSAVLMALSIIYIIVFMILCIYIAFNSRKIRMEDFKHSNQVIFLLGVTLVNVAITVPTLVVFLLRKNEPVGWAVFTMNSIIFAFSCQLILFFPKIAYVVLEKRFLRLQKYLSRLVLSARQVVFA